jgi:hypothetical protein
MGTHDKIEALVLSDSEGNMYAIPRETLERYKVTGEQKAEVQRSLGDDVQGFGFDMNRADANAAAAAARAAGAQPYAPAPMGADMDAAASYADANAAANANAFAAALGASPMAQVAGAFANLSASLFGPRAV